MNFIFDLYGTLADIWTDEGKAEVWRSLSEALRGCRRRYKFAKEQYASLCAAEKKYEGHEFDLLKVFEKMLLSEGKDTSFAGQVAHNFRDASMIRLSLFPHVMEMLSGLRARGAGVYLLSNAQSCFTRRELDTLGIAELFDGIIISSEVGWKKPHKEIFDIAFEKFGICAEDSFYVGNDMMDDILGATGAGMRTVYIETEQSRNYDVESLPSPTFIAKDHEDLKKILFSLAEGAK